MLTFTSRSLLVTDQLHPDINNAPNDRQENCESYQKLASQVYIADRMSLQRALLTTRNSALEIYLFHRIAKLMMPQMNSTETI